MIRSGLIALAVVLAAVPASAGAAGVPDNLADQFHCFVTFSGGARPDGSTYWNDADRGTITLNTRFVAKTGELLPGTYDYDGFENWQRGSGRWTWDGASVGFADGPFGSALEGRYYPMHRLMPNDDQVGRSFPLVLSAPAPDARTGNAVGPAQTGHEGEDSFATSYWYCGQYGQEISTALVHVRSYVQRTARVPVRVPLWFPTRSQAAYSGRVRVARKGYFRIDLVPPGCRKLPCGEAAIFSGKRASAGQLGHRTRVRLGHGIVGWEGDYGCAFNGTDPDWGPVYCGRKAIVWHQAGVNYCIEATNVTDADLIVAARQAVTS